MITCEYIENSPDVFEEIAELLQAHKEELCLFDNVELDVDWTNYHKLAELKILHVCTARNENKDLVGYCSSVLIRHLHYNFIMAANDVLYLKPEYRGHGIRFIRFVEKALIESGVDIFSLSVKPHVDFSPVVERFGYKLLEKQYWRRLK